ncbi:MAG: ankyrin repeat domain-containing protein [Termitinemataceae bacterium]|nr:MAG: ankyrin repeat domain-containing protein [Termitinemataceae bacterium]
MDFSIYNLFKRTNTSKVLFVCCAFLLVLGITDLFAAGGKQPDGTNVNGEKNEDTNTTVDQIGKLISAGKLDEARTLFVSENTPNSLSANGQNVLHKAANERQAELCDFFIRLGTSVDTADNSGNTPLNISQNLLDSPTAAVLVANGADIHHAGSTGTSAAVFAVEKRDISFLRSLLTDKSVFQLDGDGKTILHIASDIGAASSVEMILTTLSNSVVTQIINKKTKSGKTPLDFAMSHKDSRAHADIGQVLIDAGGNSVDRIYPYIAPAIRSLNFNIHASDGNAALHFAIREKYVGWVYYLLDHYADPNVKNTAGSTPIIEAARTGNLDIMRYLINKGADVNIQDGQGNTPMHIAIPPEVHKPALDMILQARGNPNLRDERGESPLHIVIRLNRPPEILLTLLQGGADISIHNMDGKTPLFVAIENKKSELIPILLQYKSDIFAATNDGKTPFEEAMKDNSTALDSLITEATVLQSDNGGNTPLLVAVKVGANIEIVRRILDKNALITARNGDGDTALHMAVRLNAAQTGELLLSRGADVFAQNAKGESPVFLTFYSGDVREWMFVSSVLQARDGLGNTILHYVTQWKLDKQIVLLASKGANLEASNVTGETPLFIAVKINSSSTIKALLDSGASINGRDTLGNTALHAAVRWNAQAAAEALIAANIDINAFNLYGKTPLHDAVRLGIFAIESLLVQRGANKEARDSDGNTPLMEAVLSGALRSVENLIHSGADVTTRNNFGETPLLIAVQNERSDIVGVLLTNGAQIYAQNSEGESPFTIALKTSPRMMLTLLEKGRDQTDNEGRSPLHIAIFYGVGLADIEKIENWTGRENAVDRQGRTALRYAVDKQNWEAGKLLTNKNYDVFAVARDGKTPADIVLTSGNKDAVRALFGGKAIGSRDSSGNTLLHYAARLSNAEIVGILLEIGADRTVKNTSGETAADIAQRWSHPDIASMLR